MDEIVKHINDTNASYRQPNAGDAKNTDLFLDNEHYAFFEGAGEHVTVRFFKENLSQAILFIASILPRKFDQSATHCIIEYSSKFVIDQLAILDALFKVDGKSVDTITQVWNARKNVVQKNGKVDNRFYFNGLMQDVIYQDSTGEERKAKFTVRNYMAGEYSELHIKKADDGIFDIEIKNVTTPYNDGKEDDIEEISCKNSCLIPLQQIFYGAPGTGKSFKIKRETKNQSKIRTTFHPDSDYSTFVGCYKPTMNEDVKYDKEGNEKSCTKQIEYAFVAQAFLKAYVKAWKFYCSAEDGTAKAQYLIIEEINRGNCAQIFGDLFQLLDRNEDGYSTYPIVADTDIQKFLSKEFEKVNVPDSLNTIYDDYDGNVAEDIKNGTVLALPNNFYIWATMNTSDQSLFPIDSAFKRRWDWKYMPIDTKKENWNIEVDGKKYSWTVFLEKVNEQIFEVTKSEDKKLGFYFCRANNNVVGAEKFVSKVIFYLYNDVFKDYGYDRKMFKDENGKAIQFHEYFQSNGDINEQKAALFLDNLDVKPIGENKEE
ncbi:AAA family ATPase [Segatella copri]|uniref:AAA family ATPase n=1 Tax=Segatella copri TaxID=165179 RepID=UPI00294AAB92|nr:AAA family ATPase [Segatella copri]WOG02841.1 AAA family ATPase [Segatella copri]